MPDGLTPDVAASDDPFVMTQLGDVNEAMLKTALTQAGKNISGRTKQPKHEPPDERNADAAQS